MNGRENNSNNLSPVHSVEKPDEFVPINYVIPVDMNIEFSDAFFCQRVGEGARVLSFFQMRQPITLPNMAQPQAVESRCVARVIMSKEQFERVVATMTQSAERD